MSPWENPFQVRQWDLHREALRGPISFECVWSSFSFSDDLFLTFLLAKVRLLIELHPLFSRLQNIDTVPIFMSSHTILQLYYYAFVAAGLRYRSPENKAAIVKEVEKNVWAAVTAGKVKPVVFKCFSLTEAVEAHQLIESGKHIGKILLLPWSRGTCASDWKTACAS